jgi:hypothetical protein
VFTPSRAQVQPDSAAVLTSAGEELKPAPGLPAEAVSLAPHEKIMQESTVALTNTSPLDLIEGTLQARERGDKPWLARTLASNSGKPVISEVDLHAANRQFLTVSIEGMWTAVEAAWKAHEYRVNELGETAEVMFQAGSSLGELTIVLVRIGDGWFYAGT